MFSPIQPKIPFAIKQNMVRVDIIKVVSEWCWFCGNALGKLKSCPTWRFKEDRENFIVTINQGQKQLLLEEENNEED